MNKNLSIEQVEDIRNRVKSGLEVLRCNVIGHQVILEEIKKRLEPLGVELSDERIMEMTEKDFMELIDHHTGRKQKQELKYHYEKQNMECRVGDIVRNLNGNSYRVLEKYSDKNILFEQLETGALVVGVDVGFFRKMPKATEVEIGMAKELINEYCRDEFGHDASFDEYPLVRLGYTENTIEDGSNKYHDIEVFADLENYKIITRVDGEIVGALQYKTMEDFIEYELECLSYDSLVSLSEQELAVVRGEERFKFDMSDVSIEWGHGRYLYGKYSEIDFAGLRREFSKEPQPNSRGEFDIEIREVLSRTESVKAGYYGEAVDKIMDMYRNGEIVLDADDFKEVDYIPAQNRECR